MSRVQVTVRCLSIATLIQFSTALNAQKSGIDFTRDIRPILSNTCFHCHGPDEGSREAELRLDTRTGLIGDEKRDGPVIPGEPDSSELVRRILSHDEADVMPPADSTRSLTESQRKLLVDWVSQGAPWKQHWAFDMPVKHEVPTFAGDNWSSNEIDRFVFERLKNQGLTPSLRAPPHVLIRRVHLDLIGLPPTVEDADLWIRRIWPDGSNGRFDSVEWRALVDDLMSSPHYGERWARRWLDLARYADTNGYEKDRNRSIWPYRDWVIDAINSRMPFDRFTVEQLAGDMLPNATQSQRIATGFHRNTMLNEEGGIDPLEFRFHAMTDRVATTGTTWLGLTLGCCQCHTHKYDPISHHEYFQVFAYLNNADEPYLTLVDSEIDEKWNSNRKTADKLSRSLIDEWQVEDSREIPWQVVRFETDGDQRIAISPGRVITIDGPNPETANYLLDVRIQEQFSHLKLQTATIDGSNGPGRTAHGNFVLTDISVEAVMKDGVSRSLVVAAESATAEQDGFDVERATDADSKSGWAIHTKDGVPEKADATFRVESHEIDFSNVDYLRIRLEQQSGGQHTIARLSLAAYSEVSADQLRIAREESAGTAFRKWVRSERANAVLWKIARPVTATSNLPILNIQPDGSVFASGDTAKRDDYVIELAPSDERVTAIRLEALPDSRLPANGPGSTYYEGTIGDFYLAELEVLCSGERVAVDSASHSYARNRYGDNPVSASLAIDGDIQTGWSVHGRQGERHVAVFNFDQEVPAGQPLTVKMSFGRHFASSLGRFRFSVTSSASKPKARKWTDRVASQIRNFPHNSADHSVTPSDALMQTFFLSQPAFADRSKEIRRLRTRPVGVSSLVMQERPPGQTRPTFRHHRGEYLQPKDRVEPQLPEILTAFSEQPRNRLEFARWLVSGRNPLTARVVVNRQWAAFFGTGIVKTVDDFGLQGEAPSHPELLDWLAVELQGSQEWSIRSLHRMIVCSSVYHQDSVVNPDAVLIDPNNRLLSYSPRYVLDAEIIRDQLLVSAGVLSDRRGGPPVKPPQPKGVTEAAYGRPSWTPSAGEARFRRSVYTFAKRTAPFAMFSTFGAPSGESCVAERTRSNSPLQALTLLNDVMLIDIARQSGRRLVFGIQAGDGARIEVLFRRTLVRPPDAGERELMLKFVADRRAGFLASPGRTASLLGPDRDPDWSDELAAEVAVWTAASRTVFGLDESLTRE